MRFITNAVPAEIHAQMNRLIAITDWKPWKRRLEWLHEQIRVNPTMPNFIAERFGLELAFEQVRQHYKTSNRYPWPPETAEQQRFYSFMAMIIRSHQRLNAIGKKRLAGMLRGALKDDYGLAALAFEMKVVAHLMGRGFDVFFHDMEEGSGFDYLAVNEKTKIEIEIECKFVSGDIGRQIHSKKMHQLGTAIFPEMATALDQECGGLLIKVLIPERLSGNDKQHKKICHLISKAIADNKTSVESNGYKISVSEFPVANSPFGQLDPDAISLDDAQGFLDDKFGLENKNVLVRFSPKKGAILVVVESARKDTVLKGIHRQLKNAARCQLTGERPGILCCELADIPPDQLLAIGNKLQDMVSDLIGRRPQIHTVVFTTPGTVNIEMSTLGTQRRTSVQETSPAYIFRNPDHFLANNPNYEVF